MTLSCKGAPPVPRTSAGDGLDTRKGNYQVMLADTVALQVSDNLLLQRPSSLRLKSTCIIMSTLAKLNRVFRKHFFMNSKLKESLCPNEK